MCCVMPPLSRAATSMPRILSSSDVLPWSTWPRKVTTGARGSRRAGSSSTASKPARSSFSRSSAVLMSSCTPSSAASSSTVSRSSNELMFGIVSRPKVSSFLSTSLAARPIASENARTVHGTWMEALVLRGAAVDTPELFRDRSDRRRRMPPSSSSPPRRSVTFLRCNCRNSRPPSRSSPPAPGFEGVRRGRTPGCSGGGAGGAPAPRSSPAAFALLPSTACLCSAFRIWSASGFAPPALALRIASSGSFTSGFWAAGSCEARAGGGVARPAAGSGASLKAGRGIGFPSLRPDPGRGLPSAGLGAAGLGAAGWLSGGLPLATPAGAM
jgi:hypothetical protein